MNLTANRAGHFGLLALLAGFTIWFAWSSWLTDRSFVNMILIGPVALLALGLIIAIGIGLILHPERDAENPEAAKGAGLRQRFGVPVGCLAFSIYVLSLETIGFDSAGILFCAATMYLMDQRNWLAIGFYSLLFGVGPVWILEYSMGVPAPTLLLR